MTKSATFCILPWVSLATNASGNLRVCCNVIPGKGFIKKTEVDKNSKINPYKIFKDDLKEAWNSETYTTLRKQMLAGERPEMCARCFKEEDAGIVSSRQRWNNHKWNDPNKEYTADAPFDIKYVDIRLSNLCNLKCRMCNPYTANLWVKEWHLVNDALDPSEYERLSRMNWPTLDKVWENLFSIAHTVDEIYLTGGEPTVIKEQIKLLDYFIDNGTAKDIRLKYNTNLVKLPPWIIEKWSHFKKVKLNCSIDAVGELDHYIRYPSKWEVIQRNFDEIRKLPNGEIEIHNTVQMYNILRLHELIEWNKPYGHKIYFNILNHPEYFNIQCLPHALKVQAEHSLQPYLHMEKVPDIIKYMWADDFTERLPEFYKFTHTIDANRGEDLFSLIPEFAQYDQ